MSHPHVSAESLYLRAWTALTVLIGLVLFTMLAAGPHLLYAGNVAWNLLRYLASPVI